MCWCHPGLNLHRSGSTCLVRPHPSSPHQGARLPLPASQSTPGTPAGTQTQGVSFCLAHFCNGKHNMASSLLSVEECCGMSDCRLLFSAEQITPGSLAGMQTRGVSFCLVHFCSIAHSMALPLARTCTCSAMHDMWCSRVLHCAGQSTRRIGRGANLGCSFCVAHFCSGKHERCFLQGCTQLCQSTPGTPARNANLRCFLLPGTFL